MTTFFRNAKVLHFSHMAKFFFFIFVRQYSVVYDVAHATGMADMEYMLLTINGRSLRNGATFTSSVPLSAATDMQTGMMTEDQKCANMPTPYIR